MEKTYTQENGGYFTLFSCLIFLVMASLLLLCLDGILLYQGKSKSNLAQAGALEHLAANYDKALWNRYQLFFLDPRAEAHLTDFGEEYYEELFRWNEKSLGGSHLLNLRLQELKIETFGTMEEQEYRYFLAQIEETMKYDTAKEGVLKVFQTIAKKSESQSQELTKVEQQLDEQQAAIQEASEDNAENALAPFASAVEEDAANKAQNFNPVSTIKSILEDGILSYVAEGKDISDTKISPSNLPSDSKKETKINLSAQILSNLSNLKDLLNPEGLETLTEKLTQKGTLAVYAKNYFNYYNRTESLEKTELKYELEYILGGQFSDRENLEYVVNRLILLRFCPNAVYAFSDVEMNEQALILAGTVVGISGSTALIEAAKYTILAAVSLLESVEDVKRLFDGEKISFVKNKSNFRWSVSGKRNLSPETEGLTYDNYLLLLFLQQTNIERQILRMQDLMQMNIEKEEPGFLIHNVRAGIRMKTTVVQKLAFLPGTYEFTTEKNYTY